MVAILLSLELNGVIKIENGKVALLKNIDDLLSHEKLVLEKMEYGKYNERFFRKIFKRYLENDMIRKGYVKEEYAERINFFHCSNYAIERTVFKEIF